MEVVEEPSIQNTTNNIVKVSVGSEETEATSVESDACHKSNGVAETTDATGNASEVASDNVNNSENNGNGEQTPSSTVQTEAPVADNVDIASEASQPDKIDTEEGNCEVISTDAQTDNTEKEISSNEEPLEQETVVEVAANVDATNEVTFETEILVEQNDNDVNENDLNKTVTGEHDNSTNLLSGLDQNPELSDALRSSDITDSTENNNCSVKQEVFNKEELLDILEGNDGTSTGNKVQEIAQVHGEDAQALETQLALQQLSRLKVKASKKRKLDHLSKTRTGDCQRNRRSLDKKHVTENKKQDQSPETNEIKESNEEIITKGDCQRNRRSLDKKHATEIKKQNEAQTDEAKESNEEIASKEDGHKKKENSIVNVLVQDWDDEEAESEEVNDKLLEESEEILKASEQVVAAQETVTTQEEPLPRTSIDSTASDGQTPNLIKSEDENRPQRRLGRVIKKKVIFDPDNPDTFTKANKNAIKNKDPSMEKEIPIKKPKMEITPQRSKSKSPLSKLQWKKPSPKNSNKQNKRLTEIDRLLMDEGAVNMIYQLTPEAPKGKKNMKTKAEFIKKIQSSTPEGKEMKFRERKKESSRSEDGEPKKILGGKHRSSLSSSVKSPSVCEDFETHSADDSIIYRRHSSSSYSSACMSPRRLSDVDNGGTQSATRVSRKASDSSSQNNTVIEQTGDVFMSDVTNTPGSDMINKDDCLSIKEKLNSKLALALNKRKRESSKIEKLIKQKKVKSEGDVGKLEHVTINFDHRLAEICIRKTGFKNSAEMLKELTKALEFINNKKDISVTLLLSECGTLSPELDLRPLLESNLEKRSKNAYEIAEMIRSVLCALEQHSKLVCAGVGGACHSVGLSLLALSDVAMASERATFAVGDGPRALPLPTHAALTARYPPLSSTLVNNLVVFGRQISASEALQNGLVSRTLWPSRFNEQIRAIARDLAAQPPQNVLLKKQLLSLRKSGAFLACLETERDLLVEYWTSAEGQELIRAALDTA